jgi:GMT-like wHTH domain
VYWRPTYRFSDRDNPDQQRFLTGFDDEWLSEELAQRLRGRTLSEDQLFEYVLKETPCYKFKTAINVLRSSGRVSPTTKTYPVRFH